MCCINLQIEDDRVIQANLCEYQRNLIPGMEKSWKIKEVVRGIEVQVVLWLVPGCQLWLNKMCCYKFPSNKNTDYYF